MIQLPFRAPLADYERRAQQLLKAFRAGDPAAIDLVRRHHPRFPRKDILWLPGWANYCKQPAVAEYPKAHGAA